jgi:hypothetical protein
MSGAVLSPVFGDVPSTYPSPVGLVRNPPLCGAARLRKAGDATQVRARPPDWHGTRAPKSCKQSNTAPSPVPIAHIVTMGGRDSISTSASSYPTLAERPVGKQIHNIYLDRLRQFTSGGQYESKGLLRYQFSFHCHPTRNTVLPSSQQALRGQSLWLAPRQALRLLPARPLSPNLQRSNISRIP